MAVNYNLFFLFLFIRFDFEQGALSPPSYDDTFFHIKYPRSVNSSSNVTQPDGFRSINTVINKQEINNNGTASGSNTQITKIKSVERIDFSKHPLPCRPFIPLTDIKGKFSLIYVYIIICVFEF